jgi:hypothetical protein
MVFRPRIIRSTAGSGKEMRIARRPVVSCEFLDSIPKTRNEKLLLGREKD